jgi:ribonuclease HI
MAGADQDSAPVVLYTDGASRGNPGQAGAGIVLKAPDGTTVARGYRYLGHATNNEAEYQAVVIGLQRALSGGFRSVTIRADSELLVRQLRGEYRVKSPHLQVLHAEALSLLRQFTNWRAEHIPRAQNAEADRLANKAIDVAHASGPRSADE